jgi:hypothetical protein
MKFYEFDEKEKKVDIFSERWYRHPESGKFYRSVTTILGIIDKGYQFEEWLKNNGHNAEIIVDRAGRFGTDFHKLVERFLKGETISYMDIAYQDERTSTMLWERFNIWFRFWKEFTSKNTVKIIDTEYITYSEEDEYAGTIDLTCLVNDELTIMDWKTGNNLGNKEKLQMQAYMKSINATKAILVHIPAIKPNQKGYKLIEVAFNEAQFDLFLATKRVFDMENTDQPKILTLPLSLNIEDTL